MLEFEYKRIWLCVCLLSSLLVSSVLGQGAVENSSTEPVPTVLEVYREFIDGNGGHANIMALKTLVINARMIYANGTAVQFKLYRKRPGMMRMRWNMPQYYIETVFDGVNGWRQITSLANGETQLNELPEEELESLRVDSSIEGPFFMVGRNAANILSIEHDVVRGIPTFRLEIDPDAETPYTSIWLNAETCQEFKLARVLTPSGSGTEVYEEIILSEMGRIEGVHFASKMEYFHDGELVKTMVVDRVRANVGIFDNYFSLK